MDALLLTSAGLTAEGTAAIAVAFLGAVATSSIGILNYRRQKNIEGQQLKLARSGQVTDRFTKAVEQLGHSNAEVRMGGIYALERIAGDSNDDLPHVADMIAAYVRHHSPADSEQYGVPTLKRRAPDVDAALRVITRSPLSDYVCKSFGRLDLSKTDLRRAQMSGAQLQNADLSQARLEGADLTKANMMGANLVGANVGPFDPRSARYTKGADLSGANLTGAAALGMLNVDTAITTGVRGLAEALHRDQPTS